MPDFSARARNASRMALSIKIEMRVLPFSGTTAPLFPFEKSYSALISFAFLSRRTASGDHAILLTAFRIDHHQQFAQVPQPDCSVPAFTLRIWVFDGQCQRILEHAFGVRE